MELITKKILGSRLMVIFMNGEIDDGRISIWDSYTDINGKHVFSYVKGTAYLNYNNITGYEKVVTVADLKYAESWNWLIPVIKKFDYLTENKIIAHSKEYEEWCDKIEQVLTREYEILPTFEVVAHAIEWFNKITNHEEVNSIRMEEAIGS